MRIDRICQRWPAYTPETAKFAPLWVHRQISVLDFYEACMEMVTGGTE